MRARVTTGSQAYVLRQNMEEAGVSHGEILRADIYGVVVGVRAGEPDGEALFCLTERFLVRRVIKPGDGGPLPARIELKGFTVPGPGAYDFRNLRISAVNGRVMVRVDRRSEVVPAT